MLSGIDMYYFYNQENTKKCYLITNKARENLEDI